MIINFFIFTAAERAHAMTLDDDSNATVDPRAIDNDSPGIGLNLNDLADNYGPGAPVALTGCFVANKRMVDDPAYQQYCPGLITYLLTLPYALLDTDTVFAPAED